jgi:hypothetical protein
MARRKHAAICSVARGEALGRREFKQGKMAVPALSKRVRTALRHCNGTKDTIKYLDAWARGWHRANAAAPGGGGLGMWPFTKKKAKQLPRDPRRMFQTVMYVPSPSGRVNQVLRGAKRRRRRR